jgi:tetratricopeptide (TPR) repeat protein
MTNNFEAAKEQLAIARSLSPMKQQIMFEQALTELQLENTDEALEIFKEAYELAPGYVDARIMYASAAYYANQPQLVDELVNTDELRNSFARNDFAIQAAYQAKDYERLIEMFGVRIAGAPNDAQLRVNLAVAYYESGNIEEAVAVLERAAEDIPAFKTQADSFITDLREGRAPGQPRVTSETVEIIEGETE